MNFLLVLVKYMGIAEKDTHVSVALFSDSANNPYHHQIAFRDFSVFDDFLAQVSTIEYPSYCCDTASTRALDRSLDENHTCKFPFFLIPKTRKEQIVFNVRERKTVPSKQHKAFAATLCSVRTHYKYKV